MVKSDGVITGVLKEVFDKSLMHKRDFAHKRLLFRSVYPTNVNFDEFYPEISDCLLFIEDRMNKTMNHEIVSDKICAVFTSYRDEKVCTIKFRRNVNFPYIKMRINNFASIDEAIITININGNIFTSTMSNSSISPNLQIEIMGYLMDAVSMILAKIYV